MEYVSTEECLRRFSTQHGFKHANREACIVRNKVCALLGIYSETGYAWFDKFILPKGVNLLKLQLLLELMGYDIVERSKLTDLQKQIGTCLALSSTTARDFAELVSVNEQTVLQWAFGESTPIAATVAKIGQALDLYGAETHVALMIWQGTIEKIGLKPLPRNDTGLLRPASGEVPHDQVVEKLAELVRAAEPLARRLVSDEFTPAERKQLRTITGLVDRSHKVFELSTHLNRLCGERARNEL